MTLPPKCNELPAHPGMKAAVVHKIKRYKKCRGSTTAGDYLIHWAATIYTAKLLKGGSGMLWRCDGVRFQSPEREFVDNWLRQEGIPEMRPCHGGIRRAYTAEQIVLRLMRKAQ